MLKRALIALVAALGLSVAVVVPAAAAKVTCPSGTSYVAGQCVISVDDPGASHPGATEPVGQGPVTCTYLGVTIPCSGTMGYWNASSRCYVQAIDAPPAADNPVWQGHTDGVIVRCSPPDCVAVPGVAYRGQAWCNDNITVYWAPFVPGVVSPAAVAQSAVSQMGLQAGQIGLAPPVRAGSMGIVGKPVWMWIADPGESTTGPITRSATAGAITVTATAVLSKVVWSMGDGKQVTCEGAKAPGTAWASSFGWSPSPTCGYVYEKSSADQVGLAYTLTSTSYWTVTWSSNDGASGTIPLQFDRSIAESVGEVQVVVIHD